MSDRPPEPNNTGETQQVRLRQKDGETERQARARISLDPALLNGLTVVNFNRPTKLAAGLDATMTALTEVAERVRGGDLQDAEAILVCQTIALNPMFGELSRRAAENLLGGSKYMEATKSYLALALKCQNQSRMTLETLGNIKNPTSFVRQANINSGNGNMQVNNGSSPARATENPNEPNKILESPSAEIRMDPGTKSEAGRGNPQVAAVEPGHRAKDG